MLLADGADDGTARDGAPAELRQRLRELTLSNDAVWARERERPGVDAPFVLKAPAAMPIQQPEAPHGHPSQRAP